MEGPKYRIGKGTEFLMLASAIAVDVITAMINIVSAVADIAAGLGLIIALIEFFITICVPAIFFFWFKVHGVGYFNFKKRKGWRLAGIIGELIPYLDIFWPGWIISIYNTCKAAREEDEEKFKKEQGGESGGSGRRGTRTSRRGSVAGSAGYRTARRGTEQIPATTRKRVPGQKQVGDKTA